MMKRPSKSELGIDQMAYLNLKLKEYLKLSPEDQEQVRKAVIEIVRNHRNMFRNKIQISHAQLVKLNLIIGITGSGKSTLFNYLNRLPLIIIEGLDSKGQKNHTIRLAVDQSKLKNEQVVAPIGHGLVSETTIPNFAPAPNSDVTYVDCAGQFDSRDILQSIINSYFKYELASQAKQVKLTIAVNYNDIHTNRGTVFRQLLKQVGNFIGLWEEFYQNRCISLVITQMDPNIKEPKKIVISAIQDICKQVKDLGPFKEILEDIVKREAVAIFLQPKYKTRKQVNEDGEQEDHPYVPEGEPFKPLSKVCSPELISQTLQETKFMKCKQGLFVHNLQKEAQDIVNIICESLIKQIKNEIVNVIMISTFNKVSQQTSSTKITIEQINAEKSHILVKIESLKKVRNINEILEIFQVNQQLLYSYISLRSDLNEFLKICNIVNIQEKITEVSLNITAFLREKVTNIDARAIDIINMQCEETIRKNTVLEEELRSKKYEVEMEFKKLQMQAEEKREQREYQRQQKQRDRQMQKQQIQRQTQLQIQRQKLRSKNQTIQKTQENRRFKMTMELQKEKIKAQQQAKRIEAERQKMEKERAHRLAQMQANHRMRMEEENSRPLTRVLTTIAEVTGKVIQVAADKVISVVGNRSM